MTPLVEVHTLEELDRVLPIEGVDLVAINNRNLEDFTVTLQTTKDILEARKDAFTQRNITVVSESGLHQPDDLNFVKEVGAKAVLIGESLVKQSDIQAAVKNLFQL